MRARVTALLRLVPLDPRGQQALVETLADWRHEEVAATAVGARLTCDLRALRAVAHTLAAITARQMIDAVQHEAAVLSLFVLMYGYLLHGLLIEGSAWLGQSPASVQFLWLAATFGGFTLPFGALALFLGTLAINHRRARPTPYLGLAAVALVVMTIEAAWGIPLLNTHFRESAFAAAGQQVVLTPVLSERTLLDLLVSGGPREVAFASMRLSLVAACPAFVLLAGPFETASRRIRWLAAALVPVLGFGLVIVGSQWLSYDHWFSPVLPWIFPMTGILAALQLRQRQLAHHTLP